MLRGVPPGLGPTCELLLGRQCSLRAGWGAALQRQGTRRLPAVHNPIPGEQVQSHTPYHILRLEAHTLSRAPAHCYCTAAVSFLGAAAILLGAAAASVLTFTCDVRAVKISSQVISRSTSHKLFSSAQWPHHTQVTWLTTPSDVTL